MASSGVRTAAKFLGRIKSRRRMCFIVGGRFFKILFFREAEKAFREANARKAHAMAPWCHLDKIANETLLATRYCGIVSSKIVSGCTPTPDQCIALARDMMGLIPQNCQWKSVFEVLDRRVTSILDRRIEPDQRARVYDAFQNTDLPVTGAHGDFGRSNILIDDDGSYKIIDWECFREDGSCIEDLCRLLGTSVRRSSDPAHDMGDIQASGMMDVIEQSGYLTRDQCIVLYALAQASCELEKKRETAVAKRLAQRLCQAFAAVPGGDTTARHTKNLDAVR